MDRLNVWRFALAAAVTFGAFSAVCALAVIVWPDGTVAFFNSWFHGLDLKLLVPPGGKPVTVSQIVLGVVNAAIVSFVGGVVLASCYNLFSGPSKRTTVDSEKARSYE
jgi:hypothetical protein